MIVLTGVKATQANLRRKQAVIAKYLRRALIAEGLKIQAESQRMVPVDKGNLKGSAFTAWKGGMPSAGKFEGEDAGTLAAGHAAAQQEAMAQIFEGVKVSVGYSAYYALFVHENLEAKHGPSRQPIPGGPNQQAKFLSKALDARRQKTLAAMTAAINKGAAS